MRFFFKYTFFGFVVAWPFLILFIMPSSLFGIQLEQRLKGPSINYLLGTDLFGRDLLYRLSYGLGISYLMAISSVIISFLGPVFLLYAYLESNYLVVRKLIDKTMNYLLVVPTIIIALLLSSFLDSNLMGIFLSITLYGFCFLYFSLKPQFVLLSKQPYIAYAKQSGFSKIRIIFNHYLKPIKASLMERLKLVFLFFIATETGLSFIGISLSPTIPSIGKILAQQYKYFYIFPSQLCLSILFFVGPQDGPLISFAIISNSSLIPVK